MLTKKSSSLSEDFQQVVITINKNGDEGIFEEIQNVGIIMANLKVQSLACADEFFLIADKKEKLKAMMKSL